jgi:biotin-dependent carboxylase-like uncharacterized protein
VIEIIAPGPLCTVQDRGRRGWAYLGVGHSGAADQPAYALANRLVGNAAGAPALECTFGQLRFGVEDACFVATAGAPCPIDVAGGPPFAHQQPVALPAGAVVTLRAPTSGLRTYIAFRGGVVIKVEMGSSSTDILSGLGPPPLVAGQLLALGPDPGTEVPTEIAPLLAPSTDPIALWPGPRRHWFGDDAARLLTSTEYEVQPDSNRVGVRLRGPALVRDVAGELLSEGLVEGAIQVPADGQLVVFLADHGTTGGYPVIAVVDPADLPRIAQARPGDRVSFRWLPRGVGRV